MDKDQLAVGVDHRDLDFYVFASTHLFRWLPIPLPLDLPHLFPFASELPPALPNDFHATKAPIFAPMQHCSTQITHD